jgi:hypothetical protein
MLATEAQIRDLANTVALQADEIASEKIPADELHAIARMLHKNTGTLRMWTDPTRLAHLAGARRQAVEGN